jgi:syntaxin 7
MSFEDIEIGGRRSGNSVSRTELLVQQQQQGSSSSDGVVAGVFRINTSVSSFRRLVNMLGTPKDTPSLREKLHAVEQNISLLVEETVARLKEENETDHLSSASTGKKLRDAKLAKDFQAVLLEFQGAQKLAQSREKAFTPNLLSPQSANQLPPLSANNRLETREEEEAALLQQTHQLLEVENEALYNEAIIEEREQGIQEIQQQIGEVSEIFKDLAQIVANQGYMIDDIESNIESTQSATIQANLHLTKAAKNSKSSEYWKCIILAIIGTVLLGFLFVMAA